MSYFALNSSKIASFWGLRPQTPVASGPPANIFGIRPYGPPLYKILGAPLIADYAFFQELSTFLLLFKFILEDKPIFRILFGDLHRWAPEVESSRTSLASRTHFEVLGLGLGLEGQVLDLGLEASSPRKLACPRLEDSTIF